MFTFSSVSLEESKEFVYRDELLFCNCWSQR